MDPDGYDSLQKALLVTIACAQEAQRRGFLDPPKGGAKLSVSGRAQAIKIMKGGFRPSDQEWIECVSVLVVDIDDQRSLVKKLLENIFDNMCLENQN